MPSYSGTFTLPAQMQAKAADNWPLPPVVLAIGDAYEGGYYVGQISTAGNGVADYNLIVGPIASAQTGREKWKNANTATPGADSLIDGPQNTADMVADGDATVYLPAHFCNNLTIGGFTDWYMPAKNELELCYFNLKPYTVANTSYSTIGNNANAVPSRATTYYSAGTPASNPAQTSAANFKDTGTEDFNSATYWSSSDCTTTTAWGSYLRTGNQYCPSKGYLARTRAVRRVAV